MGGRVGFGEFIDQAVSRHLENDLDITEFTYYKCSPSQPFLVHEYTKGANSNKPEEFGFDPTKQSVALTFVLTTEQVFSPRNEASGFIWAGKEKIKAMEFDFGQKTVVEKILNEL